MRGWSTLTFNKAGRLLKEKALRIIRIQIRTAIMPSMTQSELRVFAILISGFQNREFKPVELGTHVELAGDWSLSCIASSLR